MRKTISLILCALMLLSACCFAIPASAAPEGTAINTADEFMNMASDGKYYLNSDITLAATYAAPFKGTLDGNGHKLTITNPIFADFSGEVKNLTIEGAIYYTDMDAAAFTVTSTSGFIATDVTNNAIVSVTGNAKYAAGFVCTALELEAPIEFNNCVNNAEISIDSTAEGDIRAGGFGSYLIWCIFNNCTNNGNVYLKGHNGNAGGFCGQAAFKAGVNTGECYNSTNNGNVTVVGIYEAADGTFQDDNGFGGGFFGQLGVKSNMAVYRFLGCLNTGTIDADYRCGGFVGYVYATAASYNAFVDIQYSINAGNVIFGKTKRANEETLVYDFGAPFVSYTNSMATTIKHSLDLGTLTLRPNAVTANDGLSFLGCSSADTSMCDIKSVYVLNKEQYKWLTWASADSNEHRRIPMADATSLIVTTLEKVKSGEVAYLINEAAASDEYGSAYDEGYAFYQTLGTDDMPSTHTSTAWVILDGTTYKNGEKPGNATTEPPVTTEKPDETAAPGDDATDAPGDDATDAPGDATDAPVVTDAPADTTEPAKSGCGSVISGAVAIIAILGSALIIKKRD